MNYSNPYLKNDQEDVIKNLLLELEKSGRVSRDSEEFAMQKLGITDAHELWRLLEQKRKESIIGGEGEEQKKEPNKKVKVTYLNSPNWTENINKPPGLGRSGYANIEDPSRVDTNKDKVWGGDVIPETPSKSAERKYEEIHIRKEEDLASFPFMMGTPFWKLRSKLPEGAYDWALSLQTNMEKVDEKLYSERYPILQTSIRGGFQSVATNDFNQIPPHIRDHIQSVFKGFPTFQFTTWWVNINNKGNYNVPHTHGGDSDLAVVWYLTDNQSSLVFHNPFSCARHNLNLAIPETHQGDIIMNANAGDFVIFPADVLHSVEQHKLDTPRISLSLNIKFELN